MTATKTLVWRGNASGAEMQPNLFEGIALTGTILAGELLDVAATGLTPSVAAATAFNTKPIFANRDVMRQKNMIDPWTINESMQAVEFRSGEFGCVYVALGQNITARHVALSSNGDGTLKIAATDGTEQILCYSDEIINTGAAAALVNVYF